MDVLELKIVSGSVDVCRFSVKRGFSPRVFSALSGSLPKIGVVGKGDTYIYLTMGIRIGVEKTLSEASQGDVGYSPRFQGLVFFTSASPDCRFLNTILIGRLLTPLDSLKSLKEGEVVSVSRV
ncbi:MAG: hypothetical protein HA496_01100 [Thaumarchaeota archaeon]|nr:hypothetical protein [Nitrososphaerota archaeon]